MRLVRITCLTISGTSPKSFFAALALYGMSGIGLGSSLRRSVCSSTNTAATIGSLPRGASMALILSSLDRRDSIECPLREANSTVCKIQEDVEADLILKCAQEPTRKLIMENRTNPKNAQSSTRDIKQTWRLIGCAVSLLFSPMHIRTFSVLVCTSFAASNYIA
jgi:hypothetical protein